MPRKKRKPKEVTKLWTNSRKSYLQLYKIADDKETLTTFWLKEGENPIEAARSAINNTTPPSKLEKFKKDGGFMNYKIIPA